MVQDARDALLVARRTDGTLIQRPLSPHLQIYQRHLVMMMSITHRATGIALSVGTLVLAWWLVAAAASDRAYAAVSATIRHPIGLLLLLGWTASLWYHTANGFRHLAWDAGYGYPMPQARASGYAVLVATAVLTLLTWVGIVLVL